jgi:hypothetical protein
MVLELRYSAVAVIVSYTTDIRAYALVLIGLDRPFFFGVGILPRVDKDAIFRINILDHFTSSIVAIYLVCIYETSVNDLQCLSLSLV